MLLADALPDLVKAVAEDVVTNIKYWIFFELLLLSAHFKRLSGLLYAGFSLGPAHRPGIMGELLNYG